MAFTRTWNAAYEALPTDANYMYEVDNYIRQVMTDIRERVAADHYFDIAGTDADHGQHSKITFQAQAVKPAAVANKGFLYIKDVSAKAELHWEDEDGNELAITSAGALSNTSSLVSSLVTKALYDAYTMLYADTNDTPAALAIAASRIVGRKAAGGIAALTGAEVMAILNTTASRIIGQKAAGDTSALTAAEVRAILATAPFVVGSDADGDIWYRASGVLARLAKGTALQFLRMNAAATAPEYSGLFAVPATGTVPVSSSLSSVLISGAGYSKFKEIYCAYAGTYSVIFDIVSDGSNHTYGKIYVNGVAAGTERDVTADTWATQTAEDIAVTAGQYIQIYCKTGGAGYVKNLILRSDAAMMNVATL